MTVYPYVPPAREYADTMLAFKDFQMASTWSVSVENDPLGPVNKIVTLIRGQRRIKSVLWHVPVGAVVRLGHGGSSYYEAFGGMGWEALAGKVEERKPPHWYVEIDGRRVLEVPEHETWPPTPPKPHVPWHLRTYWALKYALTQQVRADLDKLAGRLGYHRDCGGDW